jgi:hypothetical protein
MTRQSDVHEGRGKYSAPVYERRLRWLTFITSRFGIVATVGIAYRRGQAQCRERQLSRRDAEVSEDTDRFLASASAGSPVTVALSSPSNRWASARRATCRAHSPTLQNAEPDCAERSARGARANVSTLAAFADRIDGGVDKMGAIIGPDRLTTANAGDYIVKHPGDNDGGSERRVKVRPGARNMDRDRPSLRVNRFKEAVIRRLPVFRSLRDRCLRQGGRNSP